MASELLTTEEQQFLLDFARATIRQAVQSGEPVVPAETDLTPRLRAPGAAFVTLRTRGGALRGCIGSLEARRPLIDDVRENAVAAAFRDPRFPPLRAEELGNLVVEVSVLSAPEPLDYTGPNDLATKLRPTVDGVVLQKGWHRATFLPQVWEQLPTPEEFLGHLCRKAGLPPAAWKQPGLEISTYQVQKFEEE